MDLLVLRHGMTEWNRDKRYLGGGTDAPLLPEGKAALCRITSLPEEMPLFVSPMRRARETAEIFFPDKPQIAVENFREMRFGQFEGKTHEEMQDWPPYRDWLDSGGTGPIPEGEQLSDFLDRTWQGLLEVIEHPEVQQTKSLVIVAHGGTVMALLHQLIGKEFYSFLPANGEGYRIQWNDEEDGQIDESGKHPACTYTRFCDGISAGSTPG